MWCGTADPEGHFYDFATRTLLRGQAGPAFQVWEENSSGRAGFAWTAGVNYPSSFLSKRNSSWAERCMGHRRLWQLRPIRSIRFCSCSHQILPGVRGRRTGSGPVEYGFMDGRRAGGDDQSHRERNGDYVQNGSEWPLRIPAPRGPVQDRSGSWAVGPSSLLGYENPNDLRLALASCAQVQFSGRRNGGAP